MFTVIIFSILKVWYVLKDIGMYEELLTAMRESVCAIPELTRGEGSAEWSRDLWTVRRSCPLRPGLYLYCGSPSNLCKTHMIPSHIGGD